MSNAKRAIMVPVMTLAVCAIAMVGLGFALSSTVTSENNTAAELMIDLSDNYSYFKTGNGVNSPGDGKVDSLLSIEINNNKVQSGETGLPNISISKGYAFMKVYGNVADYTLVINASPATVSNVTFSIFECPSTTGELTNALGTATMTSGSATFSKEPACGTPYIIAITQIGTCSITYDATVSGDTITLTGSGEFTDSTNTIANVTGIKYTITATVN